MISWNSSSNLLPLKVSILGIVAAGKVLYQSDSISWIACVEVTIARCVESHLVSPIISSEKCTKKLYLIEAVMRAIPLILLESNPGCLESFYWTLGEGRQLVSQLLKLSIIIEIVQEGYLDASPSLKETCFQLFHPRSSFPARE